ncbi:interleukin-11 receptor subunit alpha [Poecilia formosa]|uniref:Ciliary neurotrophic factor receptor subunit alpha-like n=1 Tax=Poecilia formosa TaxID=48698 RepID=A0A087YB35_POEFO|nr:PREDICTED: ciliary neurotrophic factor receptor subunit alpha-like [Poecilia formosa]XP_007541594.1 PREDICTED: ciliary neurotrophic factor receptor subunit alpha-like [Poecilia formosa]
MPGLLSSPVCLTVIWFLSWSLPPSRAQIWSDEVSDVQFGRLESNVTLACGKSQISVPVVWRHNHSSVSSWHQVTFNGSLVLFLVDQSAQGNYSCYDDSGLLLHSVILRLGYPPGLLSISCRVPNHTFVRCTWKDSVKTFLPAKYNTSFRGKEEKEPTKVCIVDSTNRRCVVEDPAFWQTIHTFGVTETNALGSQTSYRRIRLNELLKPDPPRSVFIEEVEGNPSKLWVTWKNPSSWPEDPLFPLRFHIRYRPQGSMHWSEMMTEENSIEIPDATPHHSNQVQVRARDDVSPESQWSEWSAPSFRTPWRADTTTHPSDDPDDIYLFSTPPETFTSKTHGVVQEDDGNLGLVILLVLFSIFILTTVLSLIFVIWMRQKRREHATKQELASMVKMKSLPI